MLAYKITIVLQYIKKVADFNIRYALTSLIPVLDVNHLAPAFLNFPTQALDGIGLVKQLQ